MITRMTVRSNHGCLITHAAEHCAHGIGRAVGRLALALLVVTAPLAAVVTASSDDCLGGRASSVSTPANETGETLLVDGCDPVLPSSSILHSLVVGELPLDRGASSANS
eukprot:5530066-Prymnesium_polylepis.1